MTMESSSSVQGLLNGASASDPTVRSDGGAVAFVVTRADTEHDRWHRSITVVDRAGAPLGSTDGPADRHPRFAPAGHSLAWIRPNAAGGDSIVGWPRADALASFPSAIRQFAWSPDATRLAVVVAAPSPGGRPLVFGRQGYKRDGETWAASAARLVVVHVADGTIDDLLDPLPSIGDIAWAGDGMSLLAVVGDDGAQMRTDLHVVSPDGTRRPLTAHAPLERAAGPLADGHTVVFIAGEGGPEPGVLRRIDTDGRVTTLTTQLDRNVAPGSPAYPGARPVLHDGRVWFTANDESASRLFSVATRGGAISPESPEGQVVHGLAAAGGLAAYTVSTTTRSGSVVTAGRTLWEGASHRPPWEVESLEVHAPDGATVPCWLLRSRSAPEGPAPTLVDLHGGPHNVANPVVGVGNLHRWLLAEQGWHVLLPNVRGSDGFGARWFRGLEPSGGWVSADVADVCAVVQAAVTNGVADAGRVAVHGYSYGGLLVAALTSTTALFRAAAMGGAPVDLRAFVASSDLPTSLWEREVGGLPWAAPDYDERSPVRRMGSVRTPTLVLHGTADHRVPVSQGEQWFQGLQALGVPSELVLYPGAAHGFVTAGPPSTVADVGGRIAEWLLRWVG